MVGEDTNQGGRQNWRRKWKAAIPVKQLHLRSKVN